MTLREVTVAATLLLALCGCARSAFLPLDVRALPDGAKYPGDHAVHLLDLQTIRFLRDRETGDASAEVDTHHQTRLLKGSGLGEFSVSYSRTFTRISKLEARVVLPDGTALPADPSKMSDRTAFTSELFSDSRLVRVPLPEVPIGGVRETRWVETYNDVRPWVFAFWFGSTEPTELSRLTIEVPTGWELDLLVEGQVGRRDEAAEGFTRIILEATQVPGFRQEPWGPPANRVLPRVQLRLKSWDSAQGPQRAWTTPEELSAWLHQKYQEVGDRAPELKPLVARVLKEGGAPTTDAEKARLLYEHAAGSVQYCAIEIGYGGWIPHSPAQVLQTQYGDCKDKANYLRALLLEAGIESNVALVHSHTGFPNRLALPSLSGTFNHAILAVKLGGEVVFADPTERTVPFGSLPARDCESPALLVSKEGASLTTTPSFSPERNTEAQRFVLEIDEAGRGAGTFAISATGVNASELKLDLLRATKKKEELIQKWLDLNALEVTAVTSVDARPFVDQAVVTGQLKAGQLISRASGPASLIRLQEFAPRWLPPVSDEPRKTPFAYRWRDSLTGEFELKLPKGAQVSAVPKGATVDSPFFRYQLEWTNQQGSLRVVRTLTRKLRTIEPGQFEAFRAAIREVHVAEAKAAVIRLGPERGQ